MDLIEMVSKAYGTLSLGMIRHQFRQDRVPILPAAAVKGHAATSLNVVSLSFRIPEVDGATALLQGFSRRVDGRHCFGSSIKGRY